MHNQSDNLGAKVIKICEIASYGIASQEIRSIQRS